MSFFLKINNSNSFPKENKSGVTINGKRLKASSSNKGTQSSEAVVPKPYTKYELIELSKKFNLPYENKTGKELADELMKIVPENLPTKEFDRFVPEGTPQEIINALNQTTASMWNAKYGEKKESTSTPFATYRFGNPNPTYNADFDGDEMNMHLPKDPKFKEELQKAGVAKWIPADLIASTDEKVDTMMEDYSKIEADHDIKNPEHNLKLIQTILTIHSFYHPSNSRKNFVDMFKDKISLCVQNTFNNLGTDSLLTQAEETILRDETIDIITACTSIDIEKFIMFGI